MSLYDDNQAFWRKYLIPVVLAMFLGIGLIIGGIALVGNAPCQYCNVK